MGKEGLLSEKLQKKQIATETTLTSPELVATAENVAVARLHRAEIKAVLVKASRDGSLAEKLQKKQIETELTSISPRFVAKPVEDHVVAGLRKKTEIKAVLVNASKDGTLAEKLQQKQV